MRVGRFMLYPTLIKSQTLPETSSSGRSPSPKLLKFSVTSPRHNVHGSRYTSLKARKSMNTYEVCSARGHFDRTSPGRKEVNVLSVAHSD